MSLVTAQYLHQLNPANPSGSDRLQQGDDHIRLVKAALRATFPNLAGPVTLTDGQINSLVGAMVPVGAIMLFAGATIPAGWAICNGQTVNRSDGTGTIATPNFVGRAPVGATADNPLGATFGQTSRTFTTGLGGGHSHTGTTGSAGAHDHSGNTGGHALTEAENGPHSHFEFADAYAGYNNLQAAPDSAPNRGGGGGSSGSSYDIGQSGGTATLGKTSNSGSGQAHSHPISADGAQSHGFSTASVDGHSHSVTIDTTQPSLSVYFIMKV